MICLNINRDTAAPSVPEANVEHEHLLSKTSLNYLFALADQKVPFSGSKKWLISATKLACVSGGIYNRAHCTGLNCVVPNS